MKTDPQNILICRLSSIGDIVLTFPLIRVLRHRFPNAELHYLVKQEYADLLRSHPGLDRVWSFDTRTGWAGLRQLKRDIRSTFYDLFVDIHRNLRSIYLRSGLPGTTVITYNKRFFRRWFLIHMGLNTYRHVVPVHRRYLQALSSLQISDDDKGLEFFVDPAEQRTIDTFMIQKGLDPNGVQIAMAPGAGFATKRWPVAFFIQTARRLIEEQGARIWIFGDHKDRSLAAEMAAELDKACIDLTGDLSLMQTACALRRMRMLVTNDTGLMHMACALDVDVVALFGPTTRELGFFPVHPHARVVEHLDLSCRPCTHVGSDKCPKGHFRCMRECSVERVVHTVHQVLRGSGPETGAAEPRTFFEGS